MLQEYYPVQVDSFIHSATLSDSLRLVHSALADSLTAIHGELGSIANTSDSHNAAVIERLNLLSQRIDSLVAADAAANRVQLAGVQWLQHAFWNFVFPGLSIVIVVGLILLAAVLAWRGGRENATLRRSIAAVLPILLLTCLVIVTSASGEHAFWLGFVHSWLWQMVAGLISGFGLLLLWRNAAESGEEVLISISILTISAMACYIMYAMMMGAGDSVGIYLIFTLTILGGDVVLNGTPTPNRRSPDPAQHL